MIRILSAHTGPLGSLSLLLLFLASPCQARGIEGVEFLAPVPGSAMNPAQTTITIRPGGKLDAATINPWLLAVAGGTSGVHPGSLVLSDDGETVVFRPHEPFAPGEEVTVSFAAGLKRADGSGVRPFRFSFSISARPAVPPDRRALPWVSTVTAGQALPPGVHADVWSGCDTALADYPEVTLNSTGAPGDEVLFLAPFEAPALAPGRLMILDDWGTPLFYRRLPQYAVDFKRQPDGTLTYFDGSDILYKYYQMDSSYAVIDSFVTGNGYVTDLHELQILDNGHVLLMSYDYQTVRMDTVVQGGDSAATVIGLIIQELDTDHNVVFQWRSWDHFSILDGSVSQLVFLDSSFIDYAHGNAIEQDSDGNLLISSRHMNEITKIDRQTGEMIWRLGLNALNNDFTFINDSRGFSHQHDIRRLPNGNITLYDNGNFLDPVYSRGLEYALDEQNMTATLVWEHRNSPDVYGPFMGNVQRFESGGSMIGWGGWSVTNFTEVDAAGSTVLEGGFVPGVFNYRTFRFPWKTNLFRVNADTISFGYVAPGDSTYRALTVTNNSARALTISCLANNLPDFYIIGEIPVTIPPHGSIGLTIGFKPISDADYTDRLYVRTENDTQLVAQRVVLTGTTLPTWIDPEEPLPAEFALGQNYPNPFNAISNFEFRLPAGQAGISNFGFVSLTIYDLLGRQVAIVVNERLPAGTYTRQWDAAGLPSGVYFYQLQAGDFVETRKLVLLR